jgi:hypothetical protein
MDKRHLSGLLIALVLLIVAAPVQAEEGLQVTLTPDREQLTVGDPVQLTLEVNHPAGYQVIIPQLKGTWGDLEVRSQSPASTVANDDSTETTRQVVEVTLFNLGQFQTPELPLAIRDGAGNVLDAVIPAVPLTVMPTLAEDDNDLRDIKPQAGLEVPAVWPWIAGGLLLAAAAAVMGWWAYRRWRGEPLFAPAVDRRSPWQAAHDELARIEGLGLLARGRFREYYTLVTDCLRTYLENQFQLRVFDRTTSELQAILRQSDLSPEQSRRLLHLFAESDLVKFAKLTPDVATAQQLMSEAREMVDATRPRLEPEESLGENATASASPLTSMATSFPTSGRDRLS